MSNKQTLMAFIERINSRDVDALGELMSDNHTFVDAHGNEVHGKEKMLGGWRGYFEWFPDYRIEVNEIFEGEITDGAQNFALFGFAGGSVKANPEAVWRLPAAWKAVVKDGQVILWQVFADTKIPFEIMTGKSSSDS